MVPLYTSPVLMIEQPKRFFGTYAQYQILDGSGQQVGSVKEYHVRARFGQSRTRRPKRYGIYGADGEKLLVLDKPKELFQKHIHVYQKRRHIGSIVQAVKFIGSRFELNDQHGETRGVITGNWSGWDFQILQNDSEVARIDKKFPGLTQSMFKTDDRYALEFQHELKPKLRKLAVAGAIAVDVLLHEDDDSDDYHRGRTGSRRSSAGSLLGSENSAKKKGGGGKKKGGGKPKKKGGKG